MCIRDRKNTMTGNGNTAEAVLKYIHTYQKTTGSVSMNVGSDSVSAGFTLSLSLIHISRELFVFSELP